MIILKLSLIRQRSLQVSIRVQRWATEKESRRRLHTIEHAPPVNKMVLPDDQRGARNKETL